MCGHFIVTDDLIHWTTEDHIFQSGMIGFCYLQVLKSDFKQLETPIGKIHKSTAS